MTAHDDAKIAEILGYSAEVCEPDSKPITAYYTSRHLVPVRHRLVEYVESVRADERERLRAQVPQLPLWGTGLVRVSDVLALLGGESDG